MKDTLILLGTHFLALAIGVAWGTGTGLYWGGRRWVALCLKQMQEALAKQAAQKK